MRVQHSFVGYMHNANISPAIEARLGYTGLNYPEAGTRKKDASNTETVHLRCIFSTLNHLKHIHCHCYCLPHPLLASCVEAHTGPYAAQLEVRVVRRQQDEKTKVRACGTAINNLPNSKRITQERAFAASGVDRSERI
eukprot:TRINITY_DN12032_c0_g1_i2.p1 TRINITY_DN12032_c0_g1~~TRINITY_DN12032_c0_g1_i2.p1  ORF type:complete len:138 (+),score=5.66 TRINITY_DN12032_c0_g1_i2:120-533(+)